VAVTDWGEEIVVEDIGAPAKDLRQFGAHSEAHWVVYNPRIHSNYILIPVEPERNCHHQIMSCFVCVWSILVRLGHMMDMR